MESSVTTDDEGVRKAWARLPGLNIGARMEGECLEMIGGHLGLALYVEVKYAPDCRRRRASLSNARFNCYCYCFNFDAFWQASTIRSCTLRTRHRFLAMGRDTARFSLRDR